MPVELSTVTKLKEDRYLWWLEVELTKVNTGTSLCLDPNGKSAVSHDPFLHFEIVCF